MHREFITLEPLSQSDSRYESDRPGDDVDDAEDLCRGCDRFLLMSNVIDRDCLEHIIGFAIRDDAHDQSETEETDGYLESELFLLRRQRTQLSARGLPVNRKSCRNSEGEAVQMNRQVADTLVVNLLCDELN